MWWEYFRLCGLTDEELIEDRNALAGLTYLGVVDETKRSLIHRYSFPSQDHALDRARAVHDPDTEVSACSGFAIDDINLTIDLKRGKTSDKPHPTALIPNNHVDNKEQVASLMRIAKWVADNGVDKPDTQFRAARDALLRLTSAHCSGNIETAIKVLTPLEAAKETRTRFGPFSLTDSGTARFRQNFHRSTHDY